MAAVTQPPETQDRPQCSSLRLSSTSTDSTQTAPDSKFEIAVSEINLSTITTYGDVLKATHLFVYSSLNPTGMLNNCVSVTLAKILGYEDVHALWKTLRGGDLDDKALSAHDIEELLTDTGRKFVFRTIHHSGAQDGFFQTSDHFMARMVLESKKLSERHTESPLASPPVVLHQDRHNIVERRKTDSIGFNLTSTTNPPLQGLVSASVGAERVRGIDYAILCGVAYVRPDQTGHCIVGSFIGRRVTSLKGEASLLKTGWSRTRQKNVSWNFLCYQHDTEGISLAHELETAQTVIFFAFVENDTAEQFFQELCDDMLRKKSLGERLAKKVHKILSR